MSGIQHQILGSGDGRGVVVPRQSGKTADVAGLARAGYRVLAVDDETKILNLMVRVIENAGFAVAQASGPEQALKLLEQQTFDLVVTDIKMPGMSGVEMAERIYRQYDGVDIAFITGYTDYDSIARAIRIQPIGFLEKPFDPEQLTVVVERAFNNKAQSIHWERSNELLRRAVEEKSKELEFQSERLLVEKEMMHEIFASANFGLVAVDRQLSIHILNSFAIKLLGMSESLANSYHGLNLSTVLPGPFVDDLIRLIRRTDESGTLCEENLSPDGEGTVLNVIAYPLSYRQEVTGIVMIVHDRTEAEMLQRRLLQTAKLASIGELAAGVAHEINNPLGFVTSNCNSLGEYFDSLTAFTSKLEEMITAAGPNVAEHLKQLRESMDIDFVLGDVKVLVEETQKGLGRVSRIVKDLKTFARVDSDTPELAQVNDLVNDALNLTRNELKYKLETETAFGELPKIYCFPNQLVQVFTNLFVNAAHAVKEKGRLTIETSAVPNFVKIIVSDDGEGIPDQHIQRIFDPFFTTKAPGKGTGMGLSITYGIIERHNGTISVESEVGEGTRFTILLPLKRDDEADTDEM